MTGSRALPRRVLLTGASGFIGQALRPVLEAAGVEVVALQRPAAVLGADADLRNARAGAGAPGVGATERLVAACPPPRARAELTDPDALEAALERCDAVVHLAAHLGQGPNDRDALWRTNVLGTRAVLQAAARRGARVLHVSSVATIRLAGGGPADEDTPGEPPVLAHYARSKRAAELDALAAGAVVVCPATVHGPGETGASAGRLLRYLQLARRLGVPPGSDTVVDVQDVCAGILAALSGGQRGRRYILGGDHVSLADLVCGVARILGEEPPRRSLPPVVARALARVAAVAESAGLPSPISAEAAVNATQDRWYSSERARRELGYTWRPWPAMVRRALALVAPGRPGR